MIFLYKVNEEIVMQNPLWLPYQKIMQNVVVNQKQFQIISTLKVETTCLSFFSCYTNNKN